MTPRKRSIDRENTDPSVTIPEYLQTSFDPASQTIPQLMQILTERSIELPLMKQRKEVYVTLFNEHIGSKRTKILAELTKETSLQHKNEKMAGKKNLIVDMEMLKTNRRTMVRRSGSDDEDESSVFMSSPAKPKMTPAKSVMTPAKCISITPAKIPSKTRLFPEEKTEEKPETQPGKRRKSMVTDSLKNLKNVKSTPLNSAHFIPENAPSPLPFMFKMTRTPANARVLDLDHATEFTAGSKTSEDPKFIGTPIRGTPGRFLNLAALTPAISLSYNTETPTSLPPKLNFVDKLQESKETSLKSNVIDRESDDERFHESDNDFIFGSSNSAQKRANQKKSEKAKYGIRSILTIVGMLLCAMVLHGYYEAKDVIGYCDNNANHVNFQGINPLGRWMPICIPCPPNGICIGQNMIGCDPQNFILKPSVLQRLFPGIPFPFFLVTPRCVDDKQRKMIEAKKKQRVDHVLTLINDQVRQWVGQAECHGLGSEIEKFPFVFETSTENKSFQTPMRDTRRKSGRVLGMPMSLMREQLQVKLSPKWTSSDFESYWNAVLQRIVDEDNTRLRLVFDRSGQHRLFVSIDDPVYDLGCRLRRSLWDTIKSYSLQLAMTGVGLLAAIMLYHYRQSGIQEAHKASVLVHDVLSLIHDEADLHRNDPVRHPMPGLAVTQLRDYLLLELLPVKATRLYDGDAVMDAHERTQWLMHDKTTRDRIWKKVRAVVLRNSNIRETAMEMKGETHAVWQWIGSSALSPRKGIKSQEN